METRERNGKWMTKDSIDVIYASFVSLKEAIAEAERRFQEPSFDVGYDYEYGDTIVYARIEGWRDATPEEVQARKDELAAAAVRQKAYEDRMEQQLRQSRPELFKD